VENVKNQKYIDRFNEWAEKHGKKFREFWIPVEHTPVSVWKSKTVTNWSSDFFCGGLQASEIFPVV
jgi:hypothetical protein